MNDKDKDILIIQRIFPKYRKDILDQLYRKCPFTLLHSSLDNGVKQVEAPYAQRISSFKFSSKESSFFLNVFPYMWKIRPKVIVHEYSVGIASLIPSYILARLLGSKFLMWGHGFDRTKGFHPERSFADRLRIFMVKRSDAVIFYSRDGKRTLARHTGADKLFVAPNCLNTVRLSAIRNRLEAEGRARVKERLGLRHRFNLIFIGRILATKKPEMLLELCEALRTKQEHDVAIHFVGKGPALPALQQRAKDMGLEDHIFFHGAVHDDTKSGELLFASDLMVMPGYVGLSVNHAFNFDCPVVTFRQREHGPFHSPEVEYILPGKTGFLVNEHTLHGLSQVVKRYLDHPQSQQKMRKEVRRMVDKVCSVHNFVLQYERAIRHAIYN